MPRSPMAEMLGTICVIGLITACGVPQRAGAPSLSAPAQIAVQTPAVVLNANFDLTLREVVGTPEEDTEVYAETFVDSKPAGKTETGKRSQQKHWAAALDEGNRLLRFEVWDSTIATVTAPDGSTSAVSGLRWPDARQPRERFIRMEAGMKTKVDLRFFDKGRQYDLQVAKEPK